MTILNAIKNFIYSIYFSILARCTDIRRRWSTNQSLYDPLISRDDEDQYQSESDEFIRSHIMGDHDFPDDILYSNPPTYIHPTPIQPPIQPPIPLKEVPQSKASSIEIIIP